MKVIHASDRAHVQEKVEEFIQRKKREKGNSDAAEAEQHAIEQEREKNSR